MADVPQNDISVRHFPGEEEPTPAEAWVSLAAVLVVLAAAVIFGLHIGAPDAEDERTAWLEAHPLRDTAQGHLEYALWLGSWPALEREWEEQLGKARRLDPSVAGLRAEYLKLYRRKMERADTAAGHVSLAGWCRSVDLKDEAREEYRTALRIEGDNAAAKKGLKELGK